MKQELIDIIKEKQNELVALEKTYTHDGSSNIRSLIIRDYHKLSAARALIKGIADIYT